MAAPMRVAPPPPPIRRGKQKYPRQHACQYFVFLPGKNFKNEVSGNFICVNGKIYEIMILWQIGSLGSI